MRAMGKGSSGKYMASGISSLIVASFGWGLIETLYGGSVPPLHYGWALYAVSGMLLVSSSIYLALGRTSEGVWALIGSFLIVGLGFFVSSFALGISLQPVGSVNVELYANDSILKSGEPLNLTISLENGTPPYSIEIDWGDNSTENLQNVYGNVTLQHTYVVSPSLPAMSATIFVRAVDSSGRDGMNALGVSVQNSDYCPVDFPFTFMCGFISKASAVVPSIDVEKLVEDPTFPEQGELREIYDSVMELSMGALGIFLAFKIAWGFFEEMDPAEGIVSSFKDTIIAISIAFLAPYVYNATAEALNAVSYNLISAIDLSWVLGWFMLEIALGIALGYFVPFIANYAAMLVFFLIIASVFVYMRYFLILTIITASPLLSIAYLHPGLKGAVRQITGMLGGLMLAGPISALLLLIMEKLLPGKSMTFGILYPVIIGILPNILGIFGLSSLSGPIRSTMKRFLYFLPSTSGKTSQSREIESLRGNAPGYAKLKEIVSEAKIRLPHPSHKILHVTQAQKKAKITNDEISKSKVIDKDAKVLVEPMDPNNENIKKTNMISNNNIDEDSQMKSTGKKAKIHSSKNI